MARVGNIYVDLIARTAQFSSDMRRATNSFDRSMRKMQRSVRRLGSALGLSFGALGVGMMIRKIINLTTEQEKATNQMMAALRSTGGVAGLTADEIAKLSDKIQGMTTYGNEAVEAMAAILLTFKNIKKENFARSLQDIVDMSARMGTDLKSSALQVGKALNDPVRGLSMLNRVGIQFDATQTQMIKHLAEIGHLSEAQVIILKELESEFKGSGAAARDSLGGALKALANSIGDTFELTKSTKILTKEFNNLAHAVDSFNAKYKEIFDLGVSRFFANFGFKLHFLGDFLRAIGAGATNVKTFHKALQFLQEDFVHLQLLTANDMLPQVGSKKNPVRVPAVMGYQSQVDMRDFAGLNKLLGDLERKQKEEEAHWRRLGQQITETYDPLAKYDQKMVELNELSNRGLISATVRTRALTAANENLRRSYTDLLMMTRNFSAGAITALSDYWSTARDVAYNTYQVFFDSFRRLEDEFTNFFTKLKFDWKSLLSSIQEDVVRMLVRQNITGPLAKMIGQSSFGAPGFLFGGPRAGGGSVNAMSAYLVGERGPEIFIPDHSGSIYPAGSAAGGVTVKIDSIQVGGGLSGSAGYRSASQIGEAVARAVMDARRNL